MSSKNERQVKKAVWELIAANSIDEVGCLFVLLSPIPDLRLK